MRDGSVPRLGRRFLPGRLLSGDLQVNESIKTTGAYTRFGMNGGFELIVDVTQAAELTSPARIDFRDVGSTEAQNPLFGSTEQPDSIGDWYGFLLRFKCETAWEANLARSIVEIIPREDPGDNYSSAFGATFRLFVLGSTEEFAIDVRSDAVATGSGAPPARTRLMTKDYDTNFHTLLVRFKHHYDDSSASTEVWWDGVQEYTGAIAQCMNNPTAGREDAWGFNTYLYGNALRPDPPVNNPVQHTFDSFQFWQERS